LERTSVPRKALANWELIDPHGQGSHAV
jgi:hypothetical protein